MMFAAAAAAVIFMPLRFRCRCRSRDFAFDILSILFTLTPPLMAISRRYAADMMR